MSAARFEIVRTDALQPWHARFVAANGRIVWTTEQYGRRRGAVSAIESITNREVDWFQGVARAFIGGRYTEVRLIDARSAD